MQRFRGFRAFREKQMHNNYYFLRQISSRLRDKLVGFTLVSCFSQNKDELVFEFNDAKSSFFIKADLQGDFSCLTFPDGFHRARKNSIDLFNDVLMKKVVDVLQFENERSFSIDLEDQLSVLFKMHGNKSNIVLLRGNEELDRFKNNIPGGSETHRHIDWSREAYTENAEKQYFTIGKLVAGKSWDEIQDIRKKLESPQYFIVRTDKKIMLSLLPMDNTIEKYDDPIQAVNAFYFRYISENAFLSKKNSTLTYLRGRISQTKGWIQKSNSKLAELRNDNHYKAWGDLLMANLHKIESGAKSVTVDDFYHNVPVNIPLDQNLSPQKNAERYYRKGKNQQIEINKLTESLIVKTSELTKLESELGKVEGATDLKGFKEISISKNQYPITNAQPYREFQYKGFKIWVGKDAKTNDELTLKYSYKEDLWLHVRDDTGSHVLLKHQAGKNFPKDVIEYAASIAAFFSKRKTESLCAVIVTPKKFVRKKKGAPAGSLIIDREDVILVEPKNPAPST